MVLTIEDLLTVCNPEDRHGRTKGLNPKEGKALAEYVLSQ